MIVSIHQPNFMPWYPFFKKIREADIFVILGHCQYQKNGDQNRFMIDNKRYTMSVNRGFDKIFNKRYISYEKDWEKIKTNLRNLYEKELSYFDSFISESMYETNSAIINEIVKLLGINTKIEYDYPTDLVATERLVDICKKNNATTYLSGKSGKSYLDLNLFVAENIDVIFQEYGDEHKNPILKVLKDGK